ncbi:MAG TPA: DUF4062 domain-containing protein [Tepidisphaeraceae bacterium]|jgi:hypothetical protein
MEKRFQVFVSSTYTDLKEERRAVIEALLELDCFPATMEVFPAANEAVWSLISRVIDDSDYYVVIIGNRYGTMDAEGLSYTEREYDYAAEIGKPILAFEHAEPGTIPFEKSDQNQDAWKRLEQFRLKVRQKVCKQWKSAEELAGVVSRSLIKAFKQYPSEGWVKARFAADPLFMLKLEKMKMQVEKLQAQSKLMTNPGPPLKDLAQGQDVYWVRYNFIDGVRRSDAIGLSWNKIICLVGPFLLRPQLERAVIEHFTATIKNLVDTSHHGFFALDPDAWQGVKVQLMALGLIMRTKAETGDDSWALTGLGEQTVIGLRALRRNSPAAASTVASDHVNHAT